MEIITPSAVPLALAPAKDSNADRVPNEPAETINDLLLSKVQECPDSIFVSYPATAKGKSDYVDYNVTQIDEFADQAAHKYVANGVLPENGKENEVVALLAPSNLDYIISIFALSRIGFAVLFLSNRLSTEAYVNLMTKLNCRKLIVGGQLDKTAEEINSEYPVSIFRILDQGDYRASRMNGQERFTVVKPPNASKRTSFIVHSSGSTGLPKPILQTHAACLSNYSSGIPYRAFLTLPLFHNHGISTLFRALVANKKIALYNSNLPLSGTTLADSMDAVQPESLHCVPYALKLMAESERGIECLKRTKMVIFGGSSCPDDLGDKLVNEGIFVVTHYGATEMGQLMTSYRDRDDKAWNYLRPFAAVKPFLKMEPVGGGIFELVVLDGLPSKVLSNSDDPPNSYHTRDTFEPHPTIPDAWKYLGRLDDRVTLINGEKVLPVPYEHRIRQNELVQEAVVFGVGKDVPGLIILRSEHAKDIPKEQLLGLLMPSIQEANSKAESFGRISPEMIEVLDFGAQYPQTDKGTVIRAAFYKQFDDVIRTLYNRFEGIDNAQEKLDLHTLNDAQLVTYLLDIFQNKIDVTELQPSTDFFDAGLDSLQASTARAHILREVELRGQTLGQNVVFEYPNIEQLANHLRSLYNQVETAKEDGVSVMRQLIEKYSDFVSRQPGSITPQGETVILTGTTGSLGAHILAQLAKKPFVKKIWCLVRAESPLTAQVRVLSTLATKGISGLGVAELNKIQSLPADLSQPNLGLTEDVLEELKDTLTTVIHSAWAVNFNLGVRSFESHHIRGTYNLLNLCLATKSVDPAKLFFCSSLSAAAGTPLPATIHETYIENLEHAQNMGYAQSKVVTEHIIKQAATKTGMKATVLRLGQICGDTNAGMWNTTEAIPLMIQSVNTIKALPALNETPSWMPVDLMATACIELAGLAKDPSEVSGEANVDISLVYQVQNHHLFHWTNDLLPALRRTGLEFTVVPQREWVRLLRQSDPDPVRNPTFKLLDFFTEKYDNDRPGRAGLLYETYKTGEKSPTVKSGFGIVEGDLLNNMVTWWKTQWS